MAHGRLGAVSRASYELKRKIGGQCPPPPTRIGAVRLWWPTNGTNFAITGIDTAEFLTIDDDGYNPSITCSNRDRTLGSDCKRLAGSEDASKDLDAILTDRKP